VIQKSLLAAQPRRLLLCAAVPLFLFAASARAAEESGETALQRKLDAPLNLTIDKQPLSDAFTAIAREAHIALFVDPASFECLPYGATTVVSARFREASLRTSLEDILAPLALEMATSGDKVIIRPTPPLAHIGRRAQWNELSLMDTLRKSQLPTLAGDWNAELRTLLGKPELVVHDQADPADHDKAVLQVRNELPASIAQALDTYAAATNQIWFPEDTGIQIMPMNTWIKRQLDRAIDVHFTNAPIQAVVDELSHLSGIRFQPEAGLYQAIPAVSLNSDKGTVQQSLDALVGAVGIAYDIQDDHITIRLPGKQSPPTAPRGDAVIGRITLPAGKEGQSLEVFLRESDLPPDLNDLRKKKIAQAIQDLAKSLRLPTTTAPATQPAP
jgi:hypothetical protein